MEEHGFSSPEGALFELTAFFNGRATAWGVFEDRFGRLRRRFEVDMRGHWEGAVFRLDESFVYDTGEREERTWVVTPSGNGGFTAACADCVGIARGVCTDDTIRMSYDFRLKTNGREFTVHFDDRIYRMGAECAVNRAAMSKWGVKIGELSLFFQRRADTETPSHLSA